MSKASVFLSFLILACYGYAQEQTVEGAERAKQKSDSAQLRVTQRTDAVESKYSSRLDSLQSLAAVSRYTDSLKIIGWSDSLHQKIDRKFTDAFVSKKIDSLRSLNLPPARFTHLSDSLVNKKLDLHMEVGSKQQALQERVTGRYNGWMQNIRGKFNLDSAGVKTQGLGTKATAINDPPSTNNEQPSTSLPNLNTGDFSSLGMSDDLTNVGGNLSIPTTDQLGSWDKNLPSLPDPMNEITGKVGEVKAITKDPGAAAEKAVGQVSEVSSATKELQAAEKLQQQNEALQMADQMKDPDALKEAAQRQAVNHFAGQDAALGGTMSQMSKYKKKYSSLGSLSEIKKNDWLPRNGLKGTPFRERFRIGLHTGFKSAGDTLLLDFYPNASYRITGRFEAGLGAIYQVRFNTKAVNFDQHNPVWGMSSFVVAKIVKSLHLRFELDGNSFPKSDTTEKPNYRDWRWSFHTGIQTNFKIGKQWTGIVQMLYNFGSSLKDGFPEKLAVRFGVQYKFPKKKVKKEEDNSVTK